MKKLYRLTIIILIPLFLIWTITCAEAKPSTRYTPETVESKPVEIVEPIEAAAPPKKGINWLWVLVGVAVVGGIAAAAGGGGGSSSSTTTTDTTPGIVDFSW